MLIDNVTVVNNTFIGAADGNRDVHPSPQATNITIAGNLPFTPALPPSNRTAFCVVGSEDACREELKGATADFKCSADFEHVEQHMLPPRTVAVEALHVDAQGNGHTDVSVVGVIYDDQNGRPGQILGTSEPVLIKADAPRSFVRLPFPYKGGVSITPHFAGEAVWLGEQAGKPTELQEGRAGGAANVTEPPGPLDLACFGFAPSSQHRACMYTPQPFASKPKVSFGPATPCSSSLSVYATIAPTPSTTSETTRTKRSM